MKDKIIMTDYYEIYCFNYTKISIQFAVYQWKQVCSFEATSIFSEIIK